MSPIYKLNKKEGIELNIKLFYCKRSLRFIRKVLLTPQKESFSKSYIIAK